MVVYNCRIDPNYFWDEMSFDELDSLIDNYNLDYQNGWNQVRFISFINANCAGNKFKQPEDLIKFSWEKSDEENELNIIHEDPEVVKQRMLEMMNNLSDEKIEFNPEYIFNEIFEQTKELKQV